MSSRLKLRAVMLSELAFLLPIIAAAGAVTYQVTSRVVRLQRQTIVEVGEDARHADLLRRITRDAACARTATLERRDADADADAEANTDSVVVLSLLGCRPTTLPADGSDQPPTDTSNTIIYRVTPGEVKRVEHFQDSPSASYTWPFQSGDVDLAIEAIDDTPRLVWISFTKRQQRQDGPEVMHKLTAAARIGPGGHP
jgi:hypothetical protein